MRAVCLLSGGIDSTVTAYIAKSEGYEIYVLTFDYGQRHWKEIDAARKIADRLKVREHKIIKVDLKQIGGSALLDGRELEKRRSAEEVLSDPRIPSSYVPMRNTIFLSLAAAYAETIKADAIFIGANAIDYSHYPDCRPEYYEAMSKVMECGSKRGVEGRPVRIITPVIRMRKAEIIKKGVSLGVPFNLTWSCYEGKKNPCGGCDSCLLREKGFREAGIRDPL
jgi:7-cyano-7-deazaguanine synthase